MTISIPRVNHRARSPRLHRRRPLRAATRSGRSAAFTLAELIVSAGLSAIILAGILSTFLLLTRIGHNASAYAEMNGRLRIAIDRFHHDARLASDLRWDSPRSLTLLLPASPEREVTYLYEPPSRLAPTGRFLRQPADQPAEILVNHIADDFAFHRYGLHAADGSETVATNDLETRQLEVSLRAVRPGSTNPIASQLALSARCLLRNKGPGS
jgi:hypothetical protein